MIVRARMQDWPAIEPLLIASGLPLDGAASAFTSGVIERHVSTACADTAVAMRRFLD